MDIEVLRQTICSWINEGFVEGELSVKPEWYVLWQPEELEEFNQDYQLSDYAPGFVAFGGNGGGELLVVNDASEVFCMPAIGMATDQATKIASSLTEFKAYMMK